MPDKAAKGALKHNRMRRKLMSFSLFIVISCSALIVATASIYYYNQLYSVIRSGLVSKAQTASTFFGGYIVEEYNEAEEYIRAAILYTEAFPDRDKIELQFISAESRIIASSNGRPSGASLSSDDVTAALTSGDVAWSSGTGTHSTEPIISVSFPLKLSTGQIIGVMRYISSLEIVNDEARRNIFVIAGVCMIAVLLVVAINLMFASIVLRPIERITIVMQRIAEGGYGTQIEDARYRDEIGEIVDSVNTMSARIASAEKTKSEFLSSISHELRTPLTAISGWSETLLFNETADETRTGLEIIRRESIRLTKMVEELLEFTRIEEGRFTLNIEKVDIVSEVEDALMTYRELLPDNDMQIRYLPCEDDIPLLNGDPGRLKQVFLNLLDNASKYARTGKRIDVSITLSEGKAVIVFRDYGKGVPKDEIDKLKTKFFKASNAQGRGSGIGLAVCDEIIRYHGGELIIENVYEQGIAEPLGLVCSIVIPINAKIADGRGKHIEREKARQL